MRPWLLAALLSLAGATLVLWPVLASPGNTIVCGWVHPDCLGNHWLLVWVAEQVASGRSLLHNDRYYWPVGDAPWLAGNGSDGFLYLPWHFLLGWPRAAAAHALTLLVLNGLGGYALARAAGASSFAALAAAPTAAMMVYGSHELGAGRFSQADFGFLALFLASWLRFLDAPSTRRALVAAILLAVTSFLYWYYGFFAVLAGAILLLGRVLARPQALLLPLGTFAAAFLALIGPLLYVFAANYADIPGADEAVSFPHPEAAGDSTWPGVPFLIGGVRHAGRALPFTTTILALIAPFIRRDRVTFSLAAVVVVFGGLMAGPLWPGGPYEQLYGLAAPLRRFWWPYRHVLVLNLAVIALAAVATSALLERFARGAKGPALGIAIALVIPLEMEVSAAPYLALHSKAELPTPFYAGVASLPGEVLLELPLSPEMSASQAPLGYQLQHQKTLLTGHAMWVDRVRPDAWDHFVATNSFLAAFIELEHGNLTDRFEFQSADLASLRTDGLSIISVNREYLPLKFGPLIGAYEQVLTDLFGAPAVSEPSAKAWVVDGWTGADNAEFTEFRLQDAPPPSEGSLPGGGQRPKSLAFSMDIPRLAQPGK